MKGKRSQGRVLWSVDYLDFSLKEKKFQSIEVLRISQRPWEVGYFYKRNKENWRGIYLYENSYTLFMVSRHCGLTEN